MPDFSTVIEELTGAGFTDSEVIQATVALARIPKIDLLIGNEAVAEFVISNLLHGFQPTSSHQQVIVDGFAKFSKREKQCYTMHHIENMSFSAIAEEIGVSKSAVQQYIERAREKLNEAANEQRNAV